MKSARFALIVLATFCTFSIAAQQPETPQPQTAPAQQPATQQAPPPQQSGQGQGQAVPAQAAPAPMPMSPVSVELTGKLDSKTAKAGDSVVLKTTEKVTMADGTVIPKGSKIMGHVTEAQPYAANSDNGRITLQFEQAQLKTGQSLPIKSAIQTVSPAASASAATGSGMPMGATMGGGATAPTPATPTAGGSTGGAGSTGSSASSGPSTSSASRSMQESSPSSGIVGSGGGTGGAPRGPAPGTTVAQNGNVVVKTTAVPGVLVASSVNGQPFSNASGALLSPRQDVRLDDGTQMVLAMATSSAPGASR